MILLVSLFAVKAMNPKYGSQYGAELCLMVQQIRHAVTLELFMWQAHLVTNHASLCSLIFPWNIFCVCCFSANQTFIVNHENVWTISFYR